MAAAWNEADVGKMWLEGVSLKLMKVEEMPFLPGRDIKGSATLAIFGSALVLPFPSI